MRLINLAKIRGLREFTSSYTYDSGANSSEKQMSGMTTYVTIGGTSPKVERDKREQSSMSKDLNDSGKRELVQYRSSLVKRLKEKKSKKKGSRTIGKRLAKYKAPLPMSIKSDIKREDNIKGDNDISPII
jgi:hypothetical protein